MPDELLVVNCGQLVTLAGGPAPRVQGAMRDVGMVPEGALLARGGRIVAAGARESVEPLAGRDAVWVDAGGRVVTPGLIDAHTHALFAGNRVAEFSLRCEGATYEEIAAAGGGILSTVARVRAASKEELLAAGRRHADWFLRCGTTTVEVKSGYGLSTEAELKMLRVIRQLQQETPLRWVPTFLGAHALPPEYRHHREDYVRLVCEEMIPRVAAERLAVYCDAFCEKGAFTVEETRQVFATAQRHNLKLRLHADQFHRSGGALVAAEMGAATADHLEQAGTEDFKALSAASVQPVLLPASVWALGRTRYPAAREMIAAGLSVVLATDFNPGTAPTPSLLLVLSLACTQMKMTPAEALTAVTINAAASLDLDAEIGSLEPGKQADFVIHDAGDYRELAYFAGLEHPWRVFLRGVEVFRRAGAAGHDPPQVAAIMAD